MRRLGPEHAIALMSLRRRALETEPLVFGSSPADDRLGSHEFVLRALNDQHEQAIFGSFSGVELVGLVGVIRVAGMKDRHKANLWGMYVAPQARGNGLARAMLNAAIGHARTWSGVEQLQLSVTETAVSAKAFYESAGFRCWGREPRALGCRREFVDEFHMVLMLDDKNEILAPVSGLRAAVQADIDFLHRFSDGPPDHVLQAQMRDGRLRIFEEAGTPVGFLKSSVLWETLPFIEVIVVLKSERGRGCGTRAVRAWEQEMAGCGFNVVLTSTQSNETAQHFWRKLGFQDCGSLSLPGKPDELFLHRLIESESLSYSKSGIGGAGVSS